jgi:hypothetical protein
MMTWGRSIAALWLAILWLPVSQHCALETLGLLQPDSWCHPSGGADGSNAPLPDDDSAVLDADQYLKCQNKVRISTRNESKVAVMASRHLPQMAPLPPLAWTSFLLNDFPSIWQFILRAALPPRAP